MKEIWFDTDVGPNFIDCVRFAEEQIFRFETNSRQLPWVVIGLVAMVQAACVLHLDERDTVGVNALGRKSRKEKIDRLNRQVLGEDVEYVQPYLARPTELLKRIQKGEEPVQLSSSSLQDLCKLVQFRNAFMHYTPKSWLIEYSVILEMLESAFSVVLQILKTPGTYTRITDVERELAIRICNRGLVKNGELKIKFT